MAAALADLSSAELEALVSKGGPVVVHFWADWSQPCSQVNAVLATLAEEHPGVEFAKVAAETQADAAAKYDVVAVPSTLVLRGGEIEKRVDGADIPAIVEAVGAVGGGVAPPSLSAVTEATPVAEPEPPYDINSRLLLLTNAAPVMLFMKGSPDEPQCGFSRQTVELLREAGVEFSHFDILQDPEVRAGIKTFSNWPTFPQLYSNGKLVGGLDVLKELKEEDELLDCISKTAGGRMDAEAALNAQLGYLIGRAPVVLFMKGHAGKPRCKFSRRMVETLAKENVSFTSFDILENETVRQGLKTFSNWPTYPQLYIGGKLVGGLDVVNELIEDGELKGMLA